MTTRIYVSRDSTALALGADTVACALEAEAKKRGVDAAVVRNGSRCMFWLEPLVEIETPAGRIGYGPIKPADVPALFGAKAAPFKIVIGSREITDIRTNYAEGAPGEVFGIPGSMG